MPAAARIDRRELAGAVADLGVLLPIAVALIVVNGLSPTAVLLPAGLLYVSAGLVYRLPIPVQPLKAFGAIAIAEGLGPGEIAAGALIMGAVFLGLGASGLVDAAARAFPRPLIRGVQLTVGLIFLSIAWELLVEPPAGFREHSLPAGSAVALAAAALAVLLCLRRLSVSLVVVAAGVVVMLAQQGGDLSLGPSPLHAPALDGAAALAALTMLVIPQLPLTFANSCLATADASRTYFRERAWRVRPGRLAATLGAANLVAGSMSGMPVCHGAGGMTAHYSFGARTAGAPLAMGVGLIVLALGAGAGLGALLAAFPLPVLAALLATAGILHIRLLRDLRGVHAWLLALVVGAIGFGGDLAIALAAGLAGYWIPVGLDRRRAGRLGWLPGSAARRPCEGSGVPFAS